jgi:hypothetical protein
MKGRDAFTHLHTGIPFQLLPPYMGLNFEIVGVGPTNSQFISCRNPKHILTKPRTFPSINYSQLDTPVVFKKNNNTVLWTRNNIRLTFGSP